MLVADGVAVFAGARFADRVPMQLFRRVAAALFFISDEGSFLTGSALDVDGGAHLGFAFPGAA